MEGKKKSGRKELPDPVGQTDRGRGRFMAEGIFGVFSPLSWTVGLQKVQWAPDTHTHTHTARHTHADRAPDGDVHCDPCILSPSILWGILLPLPLVFPPVLLFSCMRSEPDRVFTSLQEKRSLHLLLKIAADVPGWIRRKSQNPFL